MDCWIGMDTGLDVAALLLDGMVVVAIVVVEADRGRVTEDDPQPLLSRWNGCYEHRAAGAAERGRCGEQVRDGGCDGEIATLVVPAISHESSLGIPLGGQPPASMVCGSTRTGTAAP